MKKRPRSVAKYWRLRFPHSSRNNLTNSSRPASVAWLFGGYDFDQALFRQLLQREADRAERDRRPIAHVLLDDVLDLAAVQGAILQ